MFIGRRVALLVLLSTAGCAGVETTEAAGGASAEVAATSHPRRVKTCDASHDREAADAASTLAMIRAEARWQDCLASADDAAVATIEANLKQAGSGLAGMTKSTLADARKRGEALCAEEDKASPNFGGTLSRVEAVACRASREHALAQLMDAFVDFGTHPVEIAEARGEHARCYAPYDAAMNDAHSTADMLQALFGLADCVANEAAAFAEPIAKVQIDNDPKVGDLATSTARVRSIIDAATSADGGLCMLLNEAGENGIGSLSRVSAGSCQGRIAEQVYAELKIVAVP
jgi:hypothetical protein